MTIGERIKRFREERGWTQDELAKKMGYTTRSAISFIESGRNQVTTKNMIRFAEVFGISPSELLGMNRPLADEDLFILETVCMDNAMKDRLMAYAKKLKEIIDEENAPTS